MSIICDKLSDEFSRFSECQSQFIPRPSPPPFVFCQEQQEYPISCEVHTLSFQLDWNKYIVCLKISRLVVREWHLAAARSSATFCQEYWVARQDIHHLYCLLCDNQIHRSTLMANSAAIVYLYIFTNLLLLWIWMKHCSTIIWHIFKININVPLDLHKIITCKKVIFKKKKIIF